jgi:hypothetical protein
MSNVVEFPTTEKPITEDEIDSPLRSISRCGKWDLRLCAHGEYRSADGRARDRGQGRQAEKAMFAVFQVTVVLKKLKADYYAAWHGERRST